ncbi:hypothetical protein UT300003_10560 [Clostridium sardiniense]
MENIFYIFSILINFIYIYVLLNLFKGNFPINLIEITFTNKNTSKIIFQRVVVLLILGMLFNLLSWYLFEKEIPWFIPLFIFQIAIINYIYRTIS